MEEMGKGLCTGGLQHTRKRFFFSLSFFSFVRLRNAGSKYREYLLHPSRYCFFFLLFFSPP